MARRLGAVRDLDVLLENLPADDELDRLRADWRARRAQAWQELLDELDAATTARSSRTTASSSRRRAPPPPATGAPRAWPMPQPALSGPPTNGCARHSRRCAAEPIRSSSISCASPRASSATRSRPTVTCSIRGHARPDGAPGSAAGPRLERSTMPTSRRTKPMPGWQTTPMRRPPWLPIGRSWSRWSSGSVVPLHRQPAA